MSHAEWTVEEGGYWLELLEEGELHNVQLLIRPRFDIRARSTLRRYAAASGFNPHLELANMVNANPVLAMLPLGGFSLMYPDPTVSERPRIVPIEPLHNFLYHTVSLPTSPFVAPAQLVFEGNVSISSTDILQIAGQLKELEKRGEANMPNIRRIADYWVTADIVAPE